MSNDPSPLKYMGTQSQETVNMAAAMTLAADQAKGKLADEADDASSDLSRAGKKMGDAASWLVGKAKDTLQSAGKQVRERARTAVTTYTKDDPLRAILIAAGMGALLMALAAVLARSGARTAGQYVRK